MNEGDRSVASPIAERDGGHWGQLRQQPGLNAHPISRVPRTEPAPAKRLRISLVAK